MSSVAKLQTADILLQSEMLDDKQMSGLASHKVVYTVSSTCLSHSPFLAADCTQEKKKNLHRTATNMSSQQHLTASCNSTIYQLVALRGPSNTSFRHYLNCTDMRRLMTTCAYDIISCKNWYSLNLSQSTKYIYI